MKKTPMTPTRRTVLLGALGGGISLFSQGCGGGGAGTRATGTGSATYKLTWPEVTRLIPQASNSIQISVLDGTKVIKTVVLQRPATEITIKELPAKKLVNLVQAFPNADGSGIAQAEVRAPVEIKADESIKVSLTMQSTIQQLEPAPAAAFDLDLNQTRQLSITPRNAEGQAVLIKANTLKWNSSNPTLVSVDNNGLATCLASGEVTITATEPESGKSVTFTVNAGPTDRLVYSQIQANVHGTDFIQLPSRPGIISELSRGNLPLYSYSYSGPTPPPKSLSGRECVIFLSRGIPAGTRVPVDGSSTTPPVAQVAIIETDSEYNDQGDLIRFHERAFLGLSGHVTLVKVEGNTHTVRLENVQLQATGNIIGGSDNVPHRPEGAGNFFVNGTVTFKPND